MEAIYGEMEVESCYTLLELPSPKKKRKSKGSVENSEKPKKPRSAYLLYYFDVHQSVQQEHPDLPQSEINKCISDSWKRLNVADRGYYLERARMEKDGIDPSSQSAAASSQDVPGFRKILPRANYVLLPKSSAGGERVERDGETDTLADGAPQAAAQETLVSPMTLGSEVELVEQCIAVEALSEDAPSQNATERLPALGQDAHKAAALLVKREESRVSYGDIGMAIESGMEGGALMPQIKSDATHLVAIIPNQGKVINTASPIMMFPLVSSVKPEPKPSFKLPIKYTRRGRGNCTTPGCVFSYVTRHKPPQCPDCGQHLGGKWVAPAKRSSVKTSDPSSGKQCDESKPHPSDPNEMSSKDTERTEEQTTASVITQKTSSDKAQDGGTAAARRAARRKRERVNAASAQQTPDRAAVKTSDGAQSAECTAVLSLGGGQIQVVTREKASSALQKRRIRAILPAPAQNNTAAQSAVVQWITVPPDKVKSDATVIKAVKPSANEHIAGLKPSTLKQLGHMITPSALQQKPITVSSNQYIITDNGIKILSMLPLKKTAGSSLALGLSTARGRGRCKNPACDYVYKNRHKPQHCPTCGCELTNKPTKKNKLTPSAEDVCSSAVLWDASQPLSGAQKEQQRHSTVSLLRSCLQFPESESELQDVFSLIQQLNGQQKHTEETSGWPSFYEPAATHCSLCQHPLLKGNQSSLAGLEECWLLTECLIRPVTLQLKVCTNLQCLAIHSFTDLHPGLFNVGNKLLVTLDLFFKMRPQIRLGDEPAHAALSIIKHSLTLTDGALSSDQLSCVQDLFCSGYWAFECLTVRDYNDMICGVCGIAPKLEIAQRNCNNVLLLKNVEFTWPDFQATDEVHVDEFWLTMENEALEQAAFPSSFPITRFDASIIAPFIPPLMRNTTVINTEKDKITADIQLRGDPSVLVRLIHEGHLIPNQMDLHSEEELRDVLEKCGIPAAADTDKVHCHTHTHTHTHTHLNSAIFMEIVLAVNMYTDFKTPDWPLNCQSHLSPPLFQYVSCSELQDQPYSLDLTATESNPHLHPLTKSASRWIVRPDRPSALHDAHHAITLCKELEPYAGAVAEICDKPEGETSFDDSSATASRRKALVFENAAYYYLYNRLLDFLSSRDIVNQQIAEVLSACQPGEVVMIRDALYRLGVAQINSDPQEVEEETADGGLDKHSDGGGVEGGVLI
ncbi:HMG domain-containing protein 3 [Sinocyclocheilus grahami]|uniref:HMG domain-containing protein 3 n=1 Tax=Sinocyclocheilus grahami TaxID=75366 RepID=UPI0007ACD16F|nr:PREDICTED: HMG domain-containing protein 3-like [Sinocyclocheilus grahami]